MTEGIEARVKSLVAVHLGRDLADVQLSSRIVEDLGADSLDVVELLQRLEEEFETAVDEREALRLQSVGDVVTYISTLREATNAPVASCAG